MDVAIYGSHDSSLCIRISGDQYRVFEFERLTKQRNSKINSDPTFRERMQYMWDLIRNEYMIDRYGTLFYAQLEREHLEILQQIFRFDHTEEMPHHICHAAGALYQSDFPEALVISSDSGGHELSEGIATFCIFHASKTEGIKKIANIPLDVCGAYTIMAIPIKEIWKEDEFTKYLSYAGKIMGLAAYGKIIDQWIGPIKNFYHQNANPETLRLLGQEIGLELSLNKIEGKDAYNLAATSQHVFEELTFSMINPFIKKYQLPILLTGGAGLNVLLNERIRKQSGVPVFVPVNPNDCGLTFGMMAYKWAPDNERKKATITYNGFGILDMQILPAMVEKHGAVQVSIKELARLISQHKIIGVLRGNSEVGPRALGNRSILCYPSKGMKDTLNKIKHREFYRPFAPVIKLEDINKYFYSYDESQFMAFCPIVRQLWHNDVPSIVHHDLTARVQTVTKDQNEWLYDLIDAVDTITGLSMLLNTSFNIKGLPMLTTIEDALHVLETTELDHVYIEGWLFTKKAE